MTVWDTQSARRSALRGTGRLCIDLQPDGDLLMTPSALWTAVHAQLPLLTVVLDNREYRNTVDHANRLGDARGRPREQRRTGAAFDDPPIDHAGLARAMGMWSTGPVTQPDQVVPAFTEALEQIDAGRPALVQVRTPQGGGARVLGGQCGDHRVARVEHVLRDGLGRLLDDLRSRASTISWCSRAASASRTMPPMRRR